MSEPVITCPKCGSGKVRRASGYGFVAVFLEMFNRWPFRCRSCRKRFYRASPPPDGVLSANIPGDPR